MVTPIRWADLRAVTADVPGDDLFFWEDPLLYQYAYPRRVSLHAAPGLTALVLHRHPTCVWERCTEPPHSLACGYEAEDVYSTVMGYCERHGQQVVQHLSHQHSVICPACRCRFPVRVE